MNFGKNSKKNLGGIPEKDLEWILKRLHEQINTGISTRIFKDTFEWVREEVFEESPKKNAWRVRERTFWEILWYSENIHVGIFERIIEGIPKWVYSVNLDAIRVGVPKETFEKNSKRII